MATIRDKLGHLRFGPLQTAVKLGAFSAESCIRKAVAERGLTPGPVGLADAKAEDEAASRWADFALPMGIQ